MNNIPKYPLIRESNSQHRSCCSCNKPCIIANGKCQIAKIRIALDCSFDEAYTLLTQRADWTFKRVNDWQQLQIDYEEWKQAGEPEPIQYEI